MPGSPIGTLHDEAVLQSKFKKKAKSTILAKTCLAAVMAYMEGTKARVFQLKEQNKVVVFRGLYEDIRLLLRTCNWKTDRKSSMQTILSNWNV